MMSSSWAISADMRSRVSKLVTLNSVSSLKRANGVRRSCDMPASIRARSWSILAKRSAKRLKSMLTSRISRVAAFSSRLVVVNWPSRSWLAANEMRFRGWLMTPVIMTAPPKDKAKVMVSQLSQASSSPGSSWFGSIRSQYAACSILKPTQNPGSPLTCAAIKVPAPKRATT